MAREFVWHTAASFIRDKTDHEISLYDGPGTVWRIVGSLTGLSESNSSDSLGVFVWVVNVGTTAFDPVDRGEDPEEVMLHGAGFAPVAANVTAQTAQPPITLASEGRRVIGAGEQVWLRFRALTGGFVWDFAWSVRVLVLLPEA